MTTQKTGAQYLRSVLEDDSRTGFAGSGCRDHVMRRNLFLTVAGSLLGLLVLFAILLL